jgi:hypothetical protein
MAKFEQFLAATYHLGSKKGSHKPDPTKEEAKFFVSITEALIDYILSLLVTPRLSDGDSIN